MPTIEFEASARVVVEVPEFPVSYAVAVLALRAQSSSMDVFALMTAIASRGRFVFVQLSCVATFAEGGSVLA